MTRGMNFNHIRSPETLTCFTELYRWSCPNLFKQLKFVDTSDRTLHAKLNAYQMRFRGGNKIDKGDEHL